MTAEPHLTSYIYKSMVKSNDNQPCLCVWGGWVVPGIPYILCPLESSNTSNLLMLMGHFLCPHKENSLYIIQKEKCRKFCVR